MTDNEVCFYSDGLRLVGNLHLPEPSGEKGAPVVVLCHGLGGIKDLVLPDIASPLVEAGFAVLRFDYRGFGSSEGKRWRLIPMEQVDDIRSAVTFISTVPEVDSTRIGVYGTSFGGGNAVVAAALDERIRCVVSQVAVADGCRWMRSLRRHWEWLEFRQRVRTDAARRVLTGESEYVSSDEIMPPDPHSDSWHKEVLQQFPERRYDLPLETGERIMEYRPVDYAPLLGNRPCLIIGAEGDAIAPTDQLYELYQVVPGPKRYHLVEGTTHHGIYSGTALAEATGEATAWFTTYLSDLTRVAQCA